MEKKRREEKSISRRERKRGNIGKREENSGKKTLDVGEVKIRTEELVRSKRERIIYREENISSSA